MTSPRPIGRIPTDRRAELAAHVDALRATLDSAHAAREQALPACRRAIRAAGSSIRAVHRLDPSAASALAAEAEGALREAQHVLAPHPSVAHAGFLHDAEKEVVEARLTAALVSGEPLLSAGELMVDPTSWMKGLAEAASELRRHLLDRLREGDLERGEDLLAAMDEVYGALVTIDYPDALTGGLRRTLDALRAVLERSRGDVTTTALQSRLQRAIERSLDGGPAGDVR
ncbi:MAG: haloacid dehalogenase [Acidimicrobiia bacterium]